VKRVLLTGVLLLTACGPLDTEYDRPVHQTPVAPTPPAQDPPPPVVVTEDVSCTVSDCVACDDCGDCTYGSVDSCTGVCDAAPPADPGSQGCEACNSCGECAGGSTDACGSGCDAVAPDESDCG
jgi:hypothetical protein